MQKERDSDSLQTLCSEGCGFYGSSATDGLCSLCYKKKPQQSPAVSATRKRVPSSSTNGVSKSTAQSTISQLESSNSSRKLKPAKDDQESTTAEASTSAENQENSLDGKGTDKSGKKKKNRCASCRKKIGLTGFECRCGGLFCPVHRYSDEHDCQFDYKGMAAQEIRRKNPVVAGEKVQKI